MITRTLDKKKIAELSKIIAQCRNVVITCHIAPDGDAIGSTLALSHVLNDMGKSARVVTPDLLPKNLMSLPGAKDVLPYTRYEDFVATLMTDADLIFCLDYNSLKRIDRLGGLLSEAKARKVMIDHHLGPEDFPDLVISHPEEPSTSSLLFRVLCALGLLPQIDKRIATCIYAGMMTDTGNFSYNSNNAELYEIVAELVRKGVDKDKLYSQIINCSTESRLRLNGYAVSEKMRLFEEHQAALITLTREELNRFGYQKGDTESLVNVPLSIAGIRYSFFLREESNYIKVSARSKGDFPVNTVCERYFGGGGHKNAAGGEFHGTMDECVETFMSILDENDKYLK